MADIEVRDRSHIDHTELVLRNLGLRKDDPAALTLVALAERYHLDPLLKHIVLIPQRDRVTKQIKHYNPYVTRDGLLHVAHRSGKLSGIVLESLEETDTHYVAWVSVYRRDFDHPVRYRGKYPKDPANAPHMRPYAEEMAIKCAEAMALRRAFDVAAPVYEEIYELHEDPEVVRSVQTVDAAAFRDVEPTAELEAAPEEPAPEVPQEAVAENVSEQLVTAEPPKRRRGRPRKTEVQAAPAEAPKRRGRPPKNAVVEVAPQPEPEPEPEPEPQPTEPQVAEPQLEDEEPELPRRVGLVAYFNEAPVHIRPQLLKEMRAHGYSYFGGLLESEIDQVAKIFANIYPPDEFKQAIADKYQLILDGHPNDPVELGLAVWRAGYGR